MLILKYKPRGIVGKNDTMRALRQREGQVSFGSVTIHHFSVAIGDNPCTRDGVPLRLDAPVDAPAVVVSIHKYEEYREATRKGDLRMSPREKIALLRSHGVSRREIKAAVEHAACVARQQQQQQREQYNSKQRTGSRFSPPPPSMNQRKKALFFQGLRQRNIEISI